MSLPKIPKGPERNKKRLRKQHKDKPECFLQIPSALLWTIHKASKSWGVLMKFIFKNLHWFLPQFTHKINYLFSQKYGSQDRVPALRHQCGAVAEKKFWFQTEIAPRTVRTSGSSLTFWAVCLCNYTAFLPTPGLTHTKRSKGTLTVECP